MVAPGHPTHRLLIVGAGCAGLSLAVRLAEAGFRDLVLVDPRVRWERDRTWCFFSGSEHPFAKLPTTRWPTWRVIAGGKQVDSRAPGVTYDCLPADVFYREALARLRAAGVRLDAGRAARAVVDRGDHVEVQVDGGVMRAEVVVDTRPPDLSAPPDPRFVRIYQHFEGWLVHTETPTFDPDVVTLMDFDVPPGRAVRFVYVLPFSPTEALVEDTHFSADTEADYPAMLTRWLDGRAGPGRWHVSWKERGLLPMTVASFPARPSRRVHRLGLAGGAARPATGYGFLAIQRAADVLARQLQTDPLGEVPAFRRRRTHWLDGVFLEWLVANPQAAAGAFLAMFQGTVPRRLVRFLSETGGVLDDAAVVGALARQVGLPMIHAARSYARRARSGVQQLPDHRRREVVRVDEP